MRGGVLDYSFNEFSIARQPGKNLVEDIPAMIRKHPLMNAYWEDKRARLEKITVPAYVVGSWTNALHSPGSMYGYSEIRSKDKWLRVHNTSEWVDYYTPENVDELRHFFDRYLKGVKNNWEKTSRVRLAILDPDNEDRVNRPEQDFPLPRTHCEKFFLAGASGTLSQQKPEGEAKTSYVADDGESKAVFICKFDKDTELTGYFKLKLWVQADGSDDMDLFTSVQKLDREGKAVPILTVNIKSLEQRKAMRQMFERDPEKAGMLFCRGFEGKLRVSRRKLDERRSMPFKPYLSHSIEQRLAGGKIVPVEIAINPLGMMWYAGEYLSLTVAGFQSTSVPVALPAEHLPVLRNKGKHIIYTGGKYDSHLLVPMV